MAFFGAAANLGLDAQIVPPRKANMVNCTGAGDTLVGAAVWGICRGLPMPSCLAVGSVAASLATEAETSVPPLCPESLGAAVDAMRTASQQP